ncbi:aryl-alcohol-oxidase from pleurotus Eryingii [Collybia nuda]|uniref:Aryl-alcohol-oxidase from pleurotus Eryingii n=1 Tax=Collybia nuda TaxID=64659 RepID=A0A9P6CE77_9AGAR|nr:aryl-alcohol-oxidase from pleurotus Eryingii [Collybia nuda]
MVSSLLPWVLASFYFLPSFGKLYQNPSELVKTTYDYIVVGAGAGGAVVAARLSEDPRISVLLVEAGISNEAVPPVAIPLMGLSLTPNTMLDWNYTTTPQPGLNNRAIAYPRGRVLGGSTSVNYMVYMRGSSDDFDRYASVTGDSGWKWDNMQQYARKNEKLVAPGDQHDTTGEFNPSLHGTSGAISVSLGGNPTPVDSRVIATTQELASEFPFNSDMVGGDVLGIGWAFASIGNGTRSSSAVGYLAPAAGRPNLDIVINAQATKLEVTGKVGNVPSFRRVLVTEKAGAAVRALTAKNEIVLSAGTFGTPALLQLSGIGDRTELREAGVATVVHNPSVGKNMSDHALLPNVWNVNNSDTYDSVLRNPDEFNTSLAQWTKDKTGPLGSHITNNLGWLRLPKTASIFKTTPDPSAGPKSSHYEMIFVNMRVNPNTPAPSTGNFMSVVLALISPTSRGSIKITSSNPFAKPLINPNLVATDFDIFTLVEAVKAAKRFVAAKAWNGYIKDAVGGLETTNTDKEIEAYVRENTNTIWHAVGTAMMSAKGASYGVVDPDLKVKGVDGLRVVDGSVLPFVPNAHTEGPIYLIAERGADLIKKDFRPRA